VLTTVDEEDLRLVHALQLAPRAPWTTLADVLGRHPTSLAERYQRLRDEGVVWVTAHPRGNPQDMTLSFHSVVCDPAARADVVESLCTVPEVYSVEESQSGRDLLLTVIVPHPRYLRETVHPALDAVTGLLRHETSFCTALHRGADSWRAGALTQAESGDLVRRTAVAPSPAARVPPSFGDIVRVLARDGRATAVDVAEACGMTPPTARRQLQRALGSGLIMLRCDVAQGVLGYPIVCQWFARLPASQHAEAAALLGSTGSLRLAASTTGATNFMFLMWLRSAADITEVEARLEHALPNLRIAETVVVSHNPKRVGWSLDPHGRALRLLTEPAPYW
jgi:DNA-binding Lrp family transcriptional regulator